jgi:hypothetical protein
MLGLYRFIIIQDWESPVNDFPSQEKSEGKKDVRYSKKRGRSRENTDILRHEKWGLGLEPTRRGIIGLFFQRV